MRRTEAKLWLTFVALLFAATSSAQAQNCSFTGSMQPARRYPPATLLPNLQQK